MSARARGVMVRRPAAREAAARFGADVLSVGNAVQMITNGLKLAITAGFTILALGIFVWRDQVAWLPGLLVAAGTLLGVRLGVGFAHKVSQRVLKWILLVMVVTVCAAAAFK